MTYDQYTADAVESHVLDVKLASRCAARVAETLLVPGVALDAEQVETLRFSIGEVEHKAGALADAYQTATGGQA